jgi:hypothetical protein
MQMTVCAVPLALEDIARAAAAAVSTAVDVIGKLSDSVSLDTWFQRLIAYSQGCYMQ